MSSQSEPIDITEKFKEILKSNGVHEPVADVVVKDSGLAGEGFASSQNLVVITFENKNVKPLNLFMKNLVDSESHTQLVQDLKAFEKEARFLMEYLPAARSFCKAMREEKLLAGIYPKCYYGDDKMIVFQNLVVDHGFGTLDREERHDFKTAKLAMINIAKHHAVSYAFIKHSGGPKRFFKKFPNLDYEGFTLPATKELFSTSLESSLARSIEILESISIDGKDKALDVLKPCVGNCIQEFLGVIAESDEAKELFVLNHGDYHGNNMMFQKDKETGEVTKQIMIDFQVTRYGNPCLDLHYYIFSSVQQAVRVSRIKDILKIYLDTFNNVCESLGYPIGVSFQEFFETFRKKLKFGFYMEVMANNGFGMKVLKYINPAEIDMREFGKVMDFHIRKMLEEHPEEKLSVAKDIVAFIQEYLDLALNYRIDESNVLQLGKGI